MVNPKEIDDMTIAEFLEYEATLKRRCAHSGFKVTNYDSVHREGMAKKYSHYDDDSRIDLYFELPPLLLCFRPSHVPISNENESLVNHNRGEIGSITEYKSGEQRTTPLMKN
nr:hypothetical protein [Tanacetum cinerariifolium]